MRWLTALKQRFFPSQQPEEDISSGHEHVEYHPAHEGETPDDLHRGRHRIKETFTNHWDLDYLPREEVEALLEKQKKSGR
ncbi:hypothetical protein MWU49_13255 [Alcanivorax sp. S6407]|uniref:hypothetical protein n=1 Tax=Alcanivorax sp. S6407 TaxID=2926424 RepID=UPI001FF3C8FB|nr:hypothetical protein [Alcanivorax sp. S6407]MCK0154681.1 hypothetical protein [Alcanivorax sp. S6407]